MDEQGYNGWRNYATWRVMLEFFDGRDWREECESKPNALELSVRLRVEVEEYIDNLTVGPDSACGLLYVGGWAQAFVAQADFYEMAENILSDWDDQ